MSKLVLASASPRRQNFCKELGLNFTIDPADVDETPIKREAPLDYVKRVTELKAQTVAMRQKGAVVLAADTTVAVGRRILGKPETVEETREMLKLMSGKRHKVLTAVSVVTAEGKHLQKVVCAKVKVKYLTAEDIERHVVNSENWQGKAGGYGIQSTAGNALVVWLQGSYSGIVGLPIVETQNLLRSAGINV